MQQEHIQSRQCQILVHFPTIIDTIQFIMQAVGHDARINQEKMTVDYEKNRTNDRLPDLASAMPSFCFCSSFIFVTCM